MFRLPLRSLLSSARPFRAQAPKPYSNTRKYFTLNNTFSRRSSKIAASAIAGAATLAALITYPRNPSTHCQHQQASIEPAFSEPEVEAQLELEREQLSIVKQLRANDNYTIYTPRALVTSEEKPYQLIIHSLRGKDKIALPPLTFRSRDGTEAVTIVHLGEAVCGHKGIVHGGLLATLLDEAFAHVAIPNLPGKTGFTANMNINYRRPCFAGRFVIIRSKLTQLEGRKAYAEASICDLEGNIYTEGTSLFVAPKPRA
ncbi:uncharacterized protein VTP21DRAFT_7450 [Calcarisporiella thermophila]|uniref:uncharacterized protein n=1 Tax=Calcarisporiella thermophila TaxID=911321 RepID=UPI00374228B9